MKTVWKIITNKFLLTGIAFGIWIIYFDQDNWTNQDERKKELRETEMNIAYLKSEISRMEKEHKNLVSNPEKLEEYAREHYKMKRDSEDLFIIEH
jgi:cell division protein FtsB